MKASLSLTILMLWLAVSAVSAQDAATCDDITFRILMDRLVSNGNRQYMRSYRPGIQLYADSLEALLGRRREAGRLMHADSAEYAASLKKLRGDWHYVNSFYDTASEAQAEAYFQEALAIYAQNDWLSKLKHAPLLHRELAQLYYKQERYDDALRHTETALARYDKDFRYKGELYVDEMTDTEWTDYRDMQSQRAMCLARLGHVAHASQLMDTVLREYSADDGMPYFEALRKKAKITMLSGAEGCERDALRLYRQYFRQVRRNALATLSTMTATEREGYWMQLRPFVADCYQTEAADPALLYDVTLFSKGLLLQLNRLSGRDRASQQALRSLSYDWRQIQQKLPANACAIEFVQYEKRGQQCMGTLVLKKSGSPKWVAMLSPDEFMNHQAYGKTNRERIYNTSGREKNALYTDTAFFSQLWNAELAKQIGGCRKVYFAPDGYLHQVAIEYMVPAQLASADFFRLTSTRRLMKSGRVRTDAALIVGGVTYNASVHSQADGNDRAAYEYLQEQHIQSLGNYLEGSKAEVDSVRRVRSAARDTLLAGSAATEEVFRQLCGRYPIVVLSTHGYFGAAKVPQGTDVKPCLSDESMSQSVLAMAGANASLGSPAFDARRMDGILSARELSSLNMENVDLVVVSACETALGYVTSDGIYGIQRGLKNAGADCLLVSLWDVDDKATCLLMSRFHQYLRGGMTAYRAFRAARRSLIEGETASGRQMAFDAATMAYQSRPVAETYEKPMFCDAFILIDAIE